MDANRHTGIIGPVKRLLLLLLLYVPVAWLTGWQTLNTAEGIQTVRLFGHRDFTWILLFAAALQCSASAGFLLLPMFMARIRSVGIAGTMRRGLCVLLVAANSIAVLGFEMVHILIIQIMNSQGQDMVNVERTDLMSLDSRITAISSGMANAHKARIQALETLADRSSRGLDGTSDARCGTICKGYHDRLAALQQQYADLGLPLAPTPTVPMDVRSLYASVSERLDLLQAQAARYAEYYSRWEKTQLPANITLALAQVGEAIAVKKARYDRMTAVDDKALAMSTAFGLMRDALKLDFSRFTAPFVMPLMYAMVPMTTLMALSALIWIVAAQVRRSETADELVARLKEERRVAAQLEQLEGVRWRSFKARMRAEMWGRGGSRPSDETGLAPAW